MLKAMHKHAKFFYVLFFIVILSFIFWGVGTVDKSTSVPVASVEKEKISLEDYWKAYDETRQMYRELLKEKFTEETEKQMNLKQRVLDSLIDEKVLLLAAKKEGIKVRDAELQDAITNEPLFMRDGRFNRDIYERTLQLNRMTPEIYEPMKRRELLLTKIRRLIGESVDVTDLDTKQAPPAAQQSLVFEMRENAVRSYIDGMKKQMKITVNQQLIS